MDRKQLKNYKEVDAKGHRFKWVNLRNDAGGPNKLRENSPRLFYPLLSVVIEYAFRKWNGMRKLDNG